MHQGAKCLVIVHGYKNKIATKANWSKLPCAILNNTLEALFQLLAELVWEKF